MAHFAELDNSNTVIGVHLVANEELLVNGVESEQKGIDFLKDFFKDANKKFVQTSYNGTIRKRYAGIGFKYDPVRDAFISPKPYESWTFDEETCKWISPKAKPAFLEGTVYLWDEITKDWFGVTRIPQA
jgi:hypothetical protein